MEQTGKNFLIRKAAIKDISRIAEILVFVKRMNYRAIFRDDAVSFGKIQVIPVAEQYSKPEILENIWVYEYCSATGMTWISPKETASFLKIAR